MGVCDGVRERVCVWEGVPDSVCVCDTDCVSLLVPVDVCDGVCDTEAETVIDALRVCVRD